MAGKEEEAASVARLEVADAAIVVEVEVVIELLGEDSSETVVLEPTLLVLLFDVDA